MPKLHVRVSFSFTFYLHLLSSLIASNPTNTPFVTTSCLNVCLFTTSDESTAVLTTVLRYRIKLYPQLRVDQDTHRDKKSVDFINMEAEKHFKDSGSPETRIGTPNPEASNQHKEGFVISTSISKKKRSTKPGSNDVEIVDDEFNPSLLKKKKKKKKASTGVSSFDVQLAEAGIPQSSSVIAPTSLLSGSDEYKLLLGRFFGLLRADHPELADGSKMANKRIPALVLYKESKKTIFASFPKLCEYLKRPDEHVAQYLFAELGTTGNFDGTRRLIIKGRFQQMQLETLIKRYMGEYVHCQTCKTLDTDLKKGENRLFFLTCNKCESRRSVRCVILRTNYFTFFVVY